MTALQLHRLRIGFNGRLEGAQTTMITARILRRVGDPRGRRVGGLVRAGRAARQLAAGADRERRRRRAVGALVYVRAVLVMQIPEAHQVSRLIRSQLGRA